MGYALRRRGRSRWDVYADEILAPLFAGGRQPTHKEQGPSGDSCSRPGRG